MLVYFRKSTFEWNVHVERRSLFQTSKDRKDTISVESTHADYCAWKQIPRGSSLILDLGLLEMKVIGSNSNLSTVSLKVANKCILRDWQRGERGDRVQQALFLPPANEVITKPREYWLGCEVDLFQRQAGNKVCVLMPFWHAYLIDEGYNQTYLNTNLWTGIDISRSDNNTEERREGNQMKVASPSVTFEGRLGLTKWSIVRVWVLV